MPVEIIDGRGYSLRHIHPTTTYPSQGATQTVLGRTFGFTWLQQAHIPTDHGFLEGSYTTRLGDSGEFSITFPNAVGALGPWRERFSSDGATEFIEIHRDSPAGSVGETLEFVGCIQRIEIDRGSVTISGPDAMGLLRRAYERDRTWTAAPQEVAAAYTRVPIPLIADDFTAGSLNAAWTAFAAFGGTPPSTSIVNGRARLTNAGGTGDAIRRDVTFTTDTWRFVANFADVKNGGSYAIAMYTSGGTDVAHIQWIGSQGQMLGGPTDTVSTDIGVTALEAGAATLILERRGRWLFGFINGRLIGVTAVPTSTIARVAVGGYGSSTGYIDIDAVLVSEQRAFLARGSDQGSYVLPGDQPSGGLRGRYFTTSDLQGLTSSIRNSRVFAPNRDSYAERLDPTLNTAAGLSLPVQPGNSGDYFAVRWFGAIYLRGDLGNYTIETTSVVDGNRVWIGKTAWGDQIIDDWTTSSGTNSVTWTAANYGSKGGWYPIIIELFVDTAAPVFRLQFTPPASYTDPGGTAITGSSKITVPSTSLSPLGCFDDRVQGTAHFDMVQQAAQAFGYQAWCEPMSLESGEFPGRLVPRTRVGTDTEVQLQPEDTDAAEPALNPGVTIDASDQAFLLVGTGAGTADGAGGQTTGEVFDLGDAAVGLFTLEAWVDAGDIAQPELLAARLNAELALRGTEWEEVRATPRAQDRVADTWPLTGAVAAMRWRPGDGVRISVPDIAVEDAAPRQVIQVSRAFVAEGRTGTQLAFRQQPRNASPRVRGHLKAALALGRNYQRQKVLITGGYTTTSGVTSGGGFSGYSRVALYPGDKVVKATLRIVYNSASVSLGVEINNSDRTSALGGGWSTTPVDVDITGYATQVSTTLNELYARLQNNGGSNTDVEFQVFIEVWR
ncbi:MAG: hypothetical protein AB7O78_01645 [Thermoleophilia bacterium]